MYTYKSTLGLDNIADLEKLFFFNLNQHRFRSNILKIIELYGRPSIIEKNNSLWIASDKKDCQNIFVTKDEQLVGILVYFRNKPDNIDLIHIAVDEQYSSTGKYAEENLAQTMIEEMRKIARRIKGIETVTVKYINRMVKNPDSFGLVIKV